jgi:hypothetical protein
MVCSRERTATADPTTKSLKPILAIIGGFLASR